MIVRSTVYSKMMTPLETSFAKSAVELRSSVLRLVYHACRVIIWNQVDSGVDFTLPWNHALPPFARPPQPLILHQPVLLNKILVEFVGPAADGADVEREDVVALRGARNGEGVPLKFAYHWQVDEHPVPWL